MRFLFALVSLIWLALPATAQSYDLEAGDVVSIEVLEDSSLNRNALVLPDGTISFPFAGSVRAAGRSVEELRGSLTRALAPNFATEPTVFVSINQLADPEAGVGDITIFVLGQVNAPGEKRIDSGLTFLQALSATGGFTPFAATNRIQLRRTDPSTGQEAIYNFDLRAAARGARISGNTRMRDGDVILVPERRLFE